MMTKRERKKGKKHTSHASLSLPVLASRKKKYSTTVLLPPFPLKYMLVIKKEQVSYRNFIN